MNPRSIAILIDGGFFLKRLPKLVTPKRCATPERIAGCIRHLCRNHVKALTGNSGRHWNQYVYRIFYYDAMPYDGKSHHPITNKPLDFNQSDVAKQRFELFDCLKTQRKFALRLGKVTLEHAWNLKPHIGKKLINARNSLACIPENLSTLPNDGKVHISLTEQEYNQLMRLKSITQSIDSSSINIGLRQKGVDMRIGTDIASLTLKKQVSTIVLVSGDSDFVPAAKLARREGIDFILDPLWQQINADLFEHIDGLQSGLSKPGMPKKPNATSQTDQTAE
jgi:uncharacterized LabA/DUF88 family protein